VKNIAQFDKGKNKWSAIKSLIAMGLVESGTPRNHPYSATLAAAIGFENDPVLCKN